jgi:hypothetical protein
MGWPLVETIGTLYYLTVVYQLQGFCSVECDATDFELWFRRKGSGLTEDQDEIRLLTEENKASAVNTDSGG